LKISVPQLMTAPVLAGEPNFSASVPQHARYMSLDSIPPYAPTPPAGSPPGGRRPPHGKEPPASAPPVFDWLQEEPDGQSIIFQGDRLAARREIERLMKNAASLRRVGWRTTAFRRDKVDAARLPVLAWMQDDVEGNPIIFSGTMPEARREADRQMRNVAALRDVGRRVSQPRSADGKSAAPRIISSKGVRK